MLFQDFSKVGVENNNYGSLGSVSFLFEYTFDKHERGIIAVYRITGNQR